MIVKVLDIFFSAAASTVTPPPGAPLVSLAHSLSPSSLLSLFLSPYSSTALCFIPVHKPSEADGSRSSLTLINSLSGNKTIVNRLADSIRE